MCFKNYSVFHHNNCSYVYKYQFTVFDQLVGLGTKAVSLVTVLIPVTALISLVFGWYSIVASVEYTVILGIFLANVQRTLREVTIYESAHISEAAIHVAIS